MKLYFIFLLIMVAACSTVKETKHRILGVDYSDVKKGIDKKTYLKDHGAPEKSLQIGQEEILLYNDGYVFFQNGKVVRRGKYDLKLTEEDALSSFVKKDKNIFDQIPHLGQPLSITSERNKYLIKYRRGAIITKGSEVIEIVDRLFSNLVFNVALNAYSDPDAQIADKKYLIIPGSEKVNPHDFQFREVKKYIANTMLMNGYKVVDFIEQADFVVMVNFGVSDPKEDVQIISKPIFIPRYVPSQTSNYYSAYGGYTSIQTPGGWTSTYAGSTTEVIKKVNFVRWLHIEAIDHNHYKINREIKPIWKVLSASSGATADYRIVLPALSYAVTNYIAQDTKKMISFQLDGEDVMDYFYTIHLHGR